MAAQVSDLLVLAIGALALAWAKRIFPPCDRELALAEPCGPVAVAVASAVPPAEKPLPPCAAALALTVPSPDAVVTATAFPPAPPPTVSEPASPPVASDETTTLL